MVVSHDSCTSHGDSVHHGNAQRCLLSLLKTPFRHPGWQVSGTVRGGEVASRTRPHAHGLTHTAAETYYPVPYATVAEYTLGHRALKIVSVRQHGGGTAVSGRKARMARFDARECGTNKLDGCFTPRTATPHATDLSILQAARERRVLSRLHTVSTTGAPDYCPAAPFIVPKRSDCFHLRRESA